MMFPTQFLENLKNSHGIPPFHRFMAVYLTTGIIKLGSIKKHFSSNSVGENKVAKLFSNQSEFTNILNHMNFDPEIVADIVQKNILKVYNPTMKITIDETMVEFFGNSINKVIIKSKPRPIGLKYYTLVDGNNVLIAWFMVFHGQSHTIIQIFGKLTKNIKGMRKIYADRYYGSKGIAISTHKKGQRFMFAIQKLRLKGILEEQLTEIDRGDMIVHENINQKGIFVATCRINRSKFMHFIFNHLSNTIIQKKSKKGSHDYIDSVVVRDYNNSMGTVDHFNQAFYKYLPNLQQQQELQCRMKALLRFTVVNAWELYKVYTRSNISQHDFLLILVADLLGMSKSNFNMVINCKPIRSTQKATCSHCDKGKELRSTCYTRCGHCFKPIHQKCYLSHIKSYLKFQ